MSFILSIVCNDITENVCVITDTRSAKNYPIQYEPGSKVCDTNDFVESESVDLLFL